MSPPSGSRPRGLTSAFTTRLQRLGLRPGPALVAVSGGVDSMVLLDLLARSRPVHRLELIVAHVDHGIHADSAAVARLVERRAAELGLRFVTTALALGATATETRARAARRAWLSRIQHELGARYVILAHQADDQAETVLMRLLKGSGPAGLAGMRPRQGALVRPLLSFSKRALARYAQIRGLSCWDDPANVDPRHLRSWLRTAVLPALATRIPDVTARLRTAARHAATHRIAWARALRRWPGLDYRREGNIHSVYLPVLEQLPPSLRAVLLETLARRAGVVPGARRLRSGFRAIAAAQSGAASDLGGGWRLERAWDRLRLVPPVPGSVPEAGRIEGARGSMIWGDFQLRWIEERAPVAQPRDGRSAWFIPGTLVVRGWRAGDRLAPLHGAGRRLAVRCFQDAHVASSDRRRWPILEGEGGLAWIPGVCRGNLLVPRAGEPALRVDVVRHA